MQYAQVALPVKTASRQETFSYQIPPELLADVAPGQRVVVPFGKQQIVGTILSLRHQPPKITGYLKPIKRLAEPFPLFNPLDLALAQKVATLYGATIGQVLESAAPKPAPKTAEKLRKEVPQMAEASRQSEGQIYGLYLPARQRLNQYIRLIKKATEGGKRCLVLFADRAQAEELTHLLGKEKISYLLMPPAGQYSDYYEAWVRATSGQYSVVLGPRKTIFLSLPELQLIIVDSPSLYGYKEEQFPYYHAVTVAKIKSRLTGCHLVLGDVAPRLYEWYEAKSGKLHYLKRARQSVAITLVDTATNRGMINESLTRYTNGALAAGQTVGFFYNRKGSGRLFRCLECEIALYCPRCDSLLSVYEEKNATILRCPQCAYQTTPPYRCEVCGSYRLGSVGLGIDAFAKIVLEHFPKAKVVTLSEQTDSLPSSYDILVTTSRLFFCASSLQFDLLATFRLDNLLHGSDWSLHEEAYIELAHLAERTQKLLLQTSEPDHPVIQAFCRQDIDQLYRAELAKRKAHAYPPISPLVRLVLAGEKKEQVKQQAEALFEKLIGLVENPDNLLPASPIGTGKLRGKYRYQIIVKSPLTKTLLATVPSNWQIDPEPVTFD